MKIALIGDSHTTAYFPPLKKLLEEKGHEVVGQVSKVGWAVYSFNKKPSFIEEAIANNPDVVIVSLGGNNGKLNDQKYGSDVAEFLQRIGYPQRKVIWVGAAIATHPSTDKRHRWTAEWFRKNLPKDIAFIDAEKFTESGHSSDGVHFTMDFYRNVWAKEVARQALPVLSLPPVLYHAKKSAPYILLVLALGGLAYAAWRRYS